MKKEKIDEEMARIDEDIVEEADKVRQSASEKASRRKKPIFIVTCGSCGGCHRRCCDTEIYRS